MNFSDFTRFDKMITPTIIKILFYVGVILSVIFGIAEIFGGIIGEDGALVFMGFLTLLLGPLFTRVYCELLIVIFKIHQNLKEINDKIEKKSDSTPTL